MISNLNAYSERELKELLAECYRDRPLFCKTFFPERFSAEFNRLHMRIMEMIDSGAKKIAIAAPRGIGKTSITTLGVEARNILFQDSNFIIHMSMSHSSASQQTENIKRELLANERVRKLFGSIKTSGANDFGMDESFARDAWVAKGTTLVLPRGAGQQIRGQLFKNHRPDIIVVDDLEDPETIANDTIRAKQKEWFFADVLKAISFFSKAYRIIYIDTLKHEDSILQSLIDDPDWESERMELCDDSFKSNVPEYMSDAEILAEWETHKRQGITDVFYREYRNLPISLDDAVFKPESMRYYDEANLYTSTDDGKKKLNLHLENFVILDPAKTTKLQSADSAIVVVGLDLFGNGLYVRDVIAGKMYPDEIYNQLFAAAARFKAKVVGVEVTSLNEFITQPIRNQMSLTGQFFELVELKARAKKEERIAALAPYYRQGFIFHNKNCCNELESQLFSFPRCRRFDIIDALAYSIEMMEMGNRYFSVPEEQIEDEFEELTDMDLSPISFEWRLT